MKFKVGDKLKANEYHKKSLGIEFVTIISINEENEVYHWEADDPFFGGKLHSGYFFRDAERFIPKDELRDNKLNDLGID